ncbi:MAG: AMP-binding protein [Gammaproteobacteria bacterium]|nr:AMP-binding protein [Gammaproteobacteria bacterium]
MKGMILYNSKLFDRSTVDVIFDCFKALLEVAVENPHKIVWELPMLTQAEQHRQIVERNNTNAPCPKPGWLVHEFFLDRAEANPKSIALVEYGGLKRIISYAELQSMAEKVARRMRALQVKGDSAVGLLMTNDSAEAIASIYGTWALPKLASWRSKPLTEKHALMQVSSWQEEHMCHLIQAILLLEASRSWRMQS